MELQEVILEDGQKNAYFNINLHPDNYNIPVGTFYIVGKDADGRQNENFGASSFLISTEIIQGIEDENFPSTDGATIYKGGQRI